MAGGRSKKHGKENMAAQSKSQQKENFIDTDREEKIYKIARQVLSLSRDNILVTMRFLDSALSQLTLVEAPGIDGMATDGMAIHYDPVYILREYRTEPKMITRCYLHMLLHCIFYHNFQYDKVEMSLWDIAADIAVENTIIHMKLPAVTLPQDADARQVLAQLRPKVKKMTAEGIYRYFRQNPPDETEIQALDGLFRKDSHNLWKPLEELFVTEDQWKKISERVKTDLNSFNKDKTGSESLVKNLEEATRERYDYAEILRRFTVMGEDISVNDDEFDYVYYTYGLRKYGNLPLIEPLEYREIYKVKEFVIAIDTSASCRGPVIRGFLKRTYSILKGTENFFQKVNIHIIQCDNEIQSDTKITCDEDFEEFIRQGKLKGFGATDFRPVFSYVEEMREQGEFENLKGLIYFTDGYGIYPERMPAFDVIFAFLEEDGHRLPVPPWSMKVILDGDDLEEKETRSELSGRE